MFKMAKKWSQAGQAFTEAGSINLKAGAKHDAATNFVDAANCYKKSDSSEAVNYLLKASEIYTDMGRFTMAAKQHQNIAGIYKTEIVDYVQATKHFEQAADYFKGEESNSAAKNCLLKVAQYDAQMEDYDKAIQIYEQVAVSALENQLLKYSAKDHFFKAALCHLCMDLLNAQHADARYCDQCPSFQDTREYKLIKTVIEHLEEQNIDGYTEAVKKYDEISRLEQRYTTLLLRIKKQISENPDLR